MRTPRSDSLPEAGAKLREFIRDSMTASALPTSTPCLDPELVSFFDSFALDLFRLQFEANPVYRSFCEARRSVPSQIGHWSQIPFLPVVAFKESICTALPESDRLREFRSSGTTTQARSRHFHSGLSLESYECSLLPWFNRHLMPDLAPWRGRLFGGPLEPPDFLFLTPPPARCPNSSLAHMFEVVRREHAPASNPFHGTFTRDGAWSLNTAAIESVLRQAVDFARPLCVLGTAFSFVELSDHLVQSGKTVVLPSGSRALETGGYKGRSRSLSKTALHSLINHALGIRLDHIVSEYGMSELSSQAYDHPIPTTAMEDSNSPEIVKPPPRTFHFPPWTRIRIVSPENEREMPPGEVGVLQVLDMANIFSVCALQTEDLAASLGHGFELHGRASSSEPRGCSLNQT